MNAKSFFSIAALCLAAFSYQANAQVTVKAGVNWASIGESATEETYTDYQNKSVNGFQAGLAFDVAPSSMVSIQPELLYIQKGGKTSYVLDEDNKREFRYYYNYVEVPVLLKVKFYDTESAGSGIYVVGGPFAGLAVSGKSKITTTVLGVSSTQENDFDFDNDDPDERQKRLDWGLSFGVGAKLSAFVIDLRYNLGINNLLDNDADNGNDEKPYRRTRGIGLTVGFQF